MTRTRIKVCGITRLDDALRAVELGVDALGFVFWPGSPRRVSLRQAAEIAAPSATGRGGRRVRGPAARRDQDDRVLPSGSVRFSCTATRRRAPGPRAGRCIKAIGVGAGFDPAAVRAWPLAVLPLLDAHDPARRGGLDASSGGTSRPNLPAHGASSSPADSARRTSVTRSRACDRSVDVSSGVEREPGIKDPERLRAFIEGVAAADADRCHERHTADHRARLRTARS